MATLLIVDDDTEIRETLHELLSQVHECHTADRAEQALAYLDIEHYDVILTDIAMPQLSGREILKCVQTKHPTTPVIVISGNASEESARELLEMGAFAYLRKPFRLEAVEDAVNRGITRHQEMVAATQQPTSNDDPAEPV